MGTSGGPPNTQGQGRMSSTLPIVYRMSKLPPWVIGGDVGHVVVDFDEQLILARRLVAEREAYGVVPGPELVADAEQIEGIGAVRGVAVGCHGALETKLSRSAGRQRVGRRSARGGVGGRSVPEGPGTGSGHLL